MGTRRTAFRAQQRLHTQPLKLQPVIAHKQREGSHRSGPPNLDASARACRADDLSVQRFSAIFSTCQCSFSPTSTSRISAVTAQMSFVAAKRGTSLAKRSNVILRSTSSSLRETRGGSYCQNGNDHHSHNARSHSLVNQTENVNVFALSCNTRDDELRQSRIVVTVISTVKDIYLLEPS